MLTNVEVAQGCDLFFSPRFLNNGKEVLIISNTGFSEGSLSVAVSINSDCGHWIVVYRASFTLRYIVAIHSQLIMEGRAIIDALVTLGSMDKSAGGPCQVPLRRIRQGE